MVTREQGIGRAAMIRLLIVGLERRLEENAEAAEQVSPEIADLLNDALADVHAAHDKLNAAAALAAAHYGDTDVTLFSGGHGEKQP